MNSDGAATELLIDALDCDPRMLADVAVMRALCERVIAEVGLKVVGEPQWHAFPSTTAGPGGCTGLYLLSESHLTVHTWPERGLAAINLCCCRPRPAFPWEAVLGDVLRARRVDVRTLGRGAT